jgi:hypothetical protein
LQEVYYPEPVRRRRIAHWCRYFSGMGIYALTHPLLRATNSMLPRAQVFLHGRHAPAHTCPIRHWRDGYLRRKDRGEKKASI